MIEKIQVKLPEQNVSISSYIRHSGDKWILCLHGIQTNKTLFSDILKNPDFNEYSFLCPDFIGFGESEKPENFTYGLHAQRKAITSLLDHLKIDRMSVIGLSLGGMVGTIMLDNMSNRLSAFCSIEGNLRIDDCGASRSASGISLRDFEDNIYPALIEYLQTSEEPSAKARLEALKKVSAQTFYKTSQSIVEHSKSGKLFDTFANTTIPRALMIGQNGSFTSRPSGDNLKTIEISNAGHFVPLDNQTQFEQTLSNFFRSL
jgi:pimeloyl-ACP methyl ester carboxylesterase